MKCISPITLKSASRKARTPMLTVPCGSCGACLYNRRVEWSFRLREENLHASSAYFVTLTYRDENLVFDRCSHRATLEKSHIQKFLKRLRRRQSRKTDQKIRYYAIGEYGSNTYRPHYHVLLFGVVPELVTEEKLIEVWQYGDNISIGVVTPASIHYCTKFHVNPHKFTDREDEFALMSRKPGIGYQYLARASVWNKRNKDMSLVVYNGMSKQRMPRYYREKLYSRGQLDYFAMKAVPDADARYWRAFRSLYRRGVEDPDKYLRKVEIDASERVTRKSIFNGKF